MQITAAPQKVKRVTQYVRVKKKAFFVEYTLIQLHGVARIKNFLFPECVDPRMRVNQPPLRREKECE